MSAAPHNFDWHSLRPADRAGRSASSTRDRLRWILALYAAALAIVVFRAVQLELTGGAKFRELAARPREVIVPLDAPRGRILAGDGTVLAVDRQALALSVHYRYLQHPPEPSWLRRQARARLTRAARRDPAQVAAAESAVRDELAHLHRRLAALCALTEDEWQRRRERIARRVQTLADKVNHRRRELHRQRAPTGNAQTRPGPLAILAGLFAPPEPLPPAEVIIVEQTVHHRLVDDLPADTAETIRANRAAFPGVRIEEYSRRAYPHGSLAAHIVGHVGPQPEHKTNDLAAARGSTGQPTVGLMGVERAGQSKLGGRAGRARHVLDRRGKPSSIEVECPPTAGDDVVLTLDPRLQRSAEQLLDRFTRRADNRVGGQRTPAAGGAIIVLDVRSGEVLVAASEPRFDPNWFAVRSERAAAVLADPRRPLFDRATRMAIPPGSVFKPVVGLALLEHGIVDAQAAFDCRGYLTSPDAMRCRLFRQQGIGHGPITLADALAQSCNVYFFHHVAQLGAAPLVTWARRFGFGRAAAADWPDQAAGALPAESQLVAPGGLAQLAIGQGTLEATPLQVARVYATIARGGTPVTVRMTRGAIDSKTGPTPRPTADNSTPLFDARVLEAVRAGLVRAVHDPAGTAFRSGRVAWLSVAGKTGTAETGGNQPDHAWFAGFAPANAPRCAFVVALEHGGSGAADAGPIARRLLEQMRRLGYFPATTATKQLPPGKG